MSNALLNLIISFLLWRAEYIKYKDIIKFLRNLHNNNNRNDQNSLSSTKNTSKIQEEKIEESFKKDQTEIIVGYTETEENMINNINESKSSNKIEKNNNVKNIINKNINAIKINNKLQIKKSISEDDYMDDDISKKEDAKDNKSIKVYKNENLKSREEKRKYNDIENIITIQRKHKNTSSERRILKENQEIPEI